MSYTVVWLRDDVVLATTRFDDLRPAVEHARTQFPIRRIRLGATRVEVRNQEGKCHLSHGGEPGGGAT